MSQLKIGMLVKLRSGSPTMTIIGMQSSGQPNDVLQAQTAWFVGKDSRKEIFALDSLMSLQDAEKEVF